MTATIAIDPQKTELELEAYVLIKQVNSLLEILNRYDLRGEDLTVPQFAILNHATMEGVPLSEISARMLCDNSNLTGIVDRLISKNLVERRPDPQDRRVSLICLTSAGAEKLRNIRPRHYSSISRRMNSLSREEVEQLRNILHMLYQNLDHDLESERSTGTGIKQTPMNGNGHQKHRTVSSLPPHTMSLDKDRQPHCNGC